MMPDNGATDLAKLNFFVNTLTHTHVIKATTTSESSMLQKDK